MGKVGGGNKNFMNNIGFGFFCFGESYYYKGAGDKIKQIIKRGYKCYILTENPEYFYDDFINFGYEIINPNDFNRIIV